MKHIVSRMSSYFPNRWPLSYLNLTKTMKTHKAPTEKKKKKKKKKKKNKNKHQDIKQKEPPQKYRLGTISSTKLLTGLNQFYRRLSEKPDQPRKSKQSTLIEIKMMKLQVHQMPIVF